MSKPLVLTSEELKLRDDLVGVDGRLYNLSAFSKVHPGGAVIEASGAYDASALYHSMHPGQDPLKSNLFQKFYVGTHRRDAADPTPMYVYDSAFALDLQKTVRKAMGATSWVAPWGFWLRTVVICALTLFFEYQWATTGSLLAGVLVGVLHAQIGLSVQHGKAINVNESGNI
jgi:cytochrome b involved in lipid metabolism